jgi:hypothetical protein
MCDHRTAAVGGASAAARLRMIVGIELAGVALLLGGCLSSGCAAGASAQSQPDTTLRGQRQTMSAVQPVVGFCQVDK